MQLKGEMSVEICLAVDLRPPGCSLSVPSLNMSDRVRVSVLLLRSPLPVLSCPNTPAKTDHPPSP